MIWPAQTSSTTTTAGRTRTKSMILRSMSGTGPYFLPSGWAMEERIWVSAWTFSMR
jgi:hypothetical protein